MFIEILGAPEGDTLDLIEKIVSTVKKDAELNVSHRPLRLLIEGLNATDIENLKSKGFKIRVYDPSFVRTPAPT